MSEEQVEGAGAEATAQAEDATERAIDEATEVAVQTTRLPELGDESAEREAMTLGHLLDVPVEVTVELGQAKMTLSELARLDAGSLVKLDREGELDDELAALKAKMDAKALPKGEE